MTNSVGATTEQSVLRIDFPAKYIHNVIIRYNIPQHKLLIKPNVFRSKPNMKRMFMKSPGVFIVSRLQYKIKLNQKKY